MSEDVTQETVAPRRTPRGRPSVMAARVLATAEGQLAAGLVEASLTLT